MSIESIGIQQGAPPAQAQGAKSANANDPLAALFADFLGLADALVARETGKKTEEPSAEQQSAELVAIAGVPFLPLPAAARGTAGEGGAAAMAKGKAVAAAAVPGMAMPTQTLVQVSAQAPAAPVPGKEATAAESKPGANPAGTAESGAALPALAINLAPSVALAVPKTVAPAGVEKEKPAVSAGEVTKSTAPVSVTIEKAPVQAGDAKRRPGAPAPVVAVAPAAPKDEPATAPAKPEMTAPATPVAAAPQTAQMPVDKAVLPQPPAVPLHAATQQLVRRVEKAIEHGEDRIRIELKPASLGGVEVHLHIADDGRVSAVVRADRADTLSLLQNDARGLEQALKDAGLRPDAGSLSFNLRHGEGHAGQQPDARGQRRRRHSEPAAFAIESVGAEPRGVRSLLGGLDIRI